MNPQRVLGIIVAITLIGALGVAANLEKGLPTVLPKYAFVSGGASGIDKLATPWPKHLVQWAVHSEAGSLASGRDRTDEQGRLTLRFEVPDVRAAVRLALVLTPSDQAQEVTRTVELIALPKDPFADFRQTLGELGIGLLPSKIMTAALKRSGLRYTQLQHDIPRDTFEGSVVILGSLIGNNLESTRAWIGSLPAGTCLIVINNGKGEKSAFSLVEYLATQKPPEKSSVFWDKHSPIWTDLSADWMDLTTCPPQRLAEPKGLTSLKILAGHMAEDGSVYPLVMQCTDFGGRRWLIWNLPQLPAENDPRWDLLLRNSLFWAHRHISADKSRQSAQET